MNTISALCSTLSPAHLNDFIKTNYGLSSKSTCSILRRGINHTYKVDDDAEKYVFRVYSLNWRSKTEIQEEVNFLLDLKKHGIQVAYPLADTKNDFIQSLKAPEGLRFAVMFSFAEGKIMRNPPPEICHKLGRYLGQFHQFSAKKTINRKSYNIRTLSIWAYEKAAGHFSAELAALKFVKTLNQKLEEDLKRLTQPR